MAKMMAFDPPPQVDLTNGWMLFASEGMRHRNDGLKATVQLHNGTLKDSALLSFNNELRRAAIAKRYAKRTHLPLQQLADALLALADLVEIEIRLYEGPGVHIDADERYVMDDDGTWLTQSDGQTTRKILLANFSALIVTDITYDDGTAETRRSFEVEATLHTHQTRYTLPARDFATMQWPIDALGAKAIVMPGTTIRDHLRAAIQTRSTQVTSHTVFRHTGWRDIAGEHCYLHGDGAITAQGLREDILVQLQGALASYRLPAPPSDASHVRTVFQASLNLRTLAPGGSMITILGAAYIAPLRPFLPDHPPDFVSWIAGPSGRFKTEYAILGMQHFGQDFSSRNVPASFIATGNSLERLSHVAKDALLLVDDYYPASDRRTRDAMDLTAGRLLRSIGNQTGRPRMKADTTLRPDLPPRCVALATGERLPEGHSTNARLLFQPVGAPADAEADKGCLSRAQAEKAWYSEAMAAYLQWIARHWDDLARQLPAVFQELRQEAATAGTHTREPGHVAHLQLGWRVFTQCAVSMGALTADERTRLLQDTFAHGQALATTQGALLQSEATVERFLALLMSGFAGKRICVRTLQDAPPGEQEAEAWGWSARTVEGWQGYTHTVYEAGQAKMVGYLDTDCLYLLPEPLQQYLVEACRAADQAWPVDARTLYCELEEARLLKTKKRSTGTERILLKKILKQPVRVLYLDRQRLLALHGEDDDAHGEPQPQESLPEHEDSIVV